MNESQTPNPTHGKTSWIIHWAFILAIVVVLNLFFNYAISLVYKQPSFDAFCPTEVVNKVYTEKGLCTEAGGQWSENTYPTEVDQKGVVTPVKVTGYCNATYTCNQAYSDAESIYNRNMFIVLVILGVGSLVAGAYLATISTIVSLGFSFGGVLSLIIGAVRYWSNMQDVLRVVILAVALAALIWVGLRKIKE